MTGHRVTMLGTGLIGLFYTMTLHGRRGRDRVHVVYSRSEERGRSFAEDWDIPVHTTDLEEAVAHPETDTVVVGLPNHLHEEAIAAAVRHGKAVLCTKPLGARRGGGEAHPRHRRKCGRLRRLPRGPRLHAEDAQGRGRRPGRSDRAGDLGTLARDASGTA